MSVCARWKLLLTKIIKTEPLAKKGARKIQKKTQFDRVIMKPVWKGSFRVYTVAIKEKKKK